MKRLVFILAFLAVVCGAWAQGAVRVSAQEQGAQGAVRDSAAAKAAVVEGAGFAFTESEFDFGRVAHSLPRIEHRFEFTNDGTEPLVITRTLTSCNCVKVQYDKKPVPAGGKGVITVIYEVNKKEAGVFYKVIELYSNAAEKRKSLVIKGVATE